MIYNAGMQRNENTQELAVNAYTPLECYILHPKSIYNEGDTGLQLLFSNQHDEMQARIEYAGLVTAASYLFVYFERDGAASLLLSGCDVHVIRWGAFLLVTRSRVLSGALRFYLELYLPDLEGILNQYGLRFCRVLLEYYVRPFIAFCAQDYKFALCCAERCVPQDVQCADLVVNAFYMLKDVCRDDSARVCVFHGANLVFDAGMDAASKLEIFVQRYLRAARCGTAAMDVDAWRAYEPDAADYINETAELETPETPNTPETPGIDVELAKYCRHVPVISAGVAYVRNPFAAAAGFSRDGEVEQNDVFLSDGRELAAYQIKIDITMFAVGSVDPCVTAQIRRHKFLNQDYYIKQIAYQFVFAINRALAECQGSPAPVHYAVFEALQPGFKRALLRGVEVERDGDELVFK